MPKHAKEAVASFGKRLAMLRKAAGYTQQELADIAGVTRRVIAYYEGETKHPPAALLPDLARALRVTTDELLGMAPVKEMARSNRRLQRRLKQFDHLSKRDQEALLRTIDAFLRKVS
jgi:transcriptional regulator with XRE-family HTH domain